MFNRCLFGKISKASVYILTALFLWSFAAATLLAQQKKGAVDLISVGEGPPPKLDFEGESEQGIKTSLEDAKKKAIISFVIETLGEERFYKTIGGIDSLILADYEKYILDSKTLSSVPVPLSPNVLLKVRVTIDAENLKATLENISKLEPEPQPRKALTTEEKDIIIKKANEKFLQGEVASEFLLYRIRGIELFLSAKSLYETVGYTEGVYKCLLGMGKAKTSIAYLSDAIEDFSEAKSLALNMKRDENIAQADLGIAKALFLMGDYIGAREVSSSIISRYPKDTEILFGESLFLLGEIDYALGHDTAAIDEIMRANSIFKKLGDMKRFNLSLLTLSLINVSSGRGKEAVDDLKLSKSLSEKLENPESRTIALIALASVYIDQNYIDTKDLDLANVFLEEAVSTAEKTGWICGEAWARTETARLLLLRGECADALSEASNAVELSTLSGSPSLLAAAFYIQGQIFLELNKRSDALKTLSACVETASDIRVLGARHPFIPFDEKILMSALSTLLELAEELKKKEIGFYALMRYQGAWLSKELFLSDIDLSYISDGKDNRGRLLSMWTNGVKDSIGAESVWLDGETNRLSESSISAIIQKRDEANRFLSDILSKISNEDPRLSRLLAAETRDPEKLLRSIDADTAIIQYFVGGGGAFALVSSASGLSIVRLNSGSCEIDMFIHDLMTCLEGEVLERETITEGEGDVAADYTPTFEEASHMVTDTIVSPLLETLSDIKAVGISPGIFLSDLPIFSLGRYNEEGVFTFLISEYDLFCVSSLSPGFLTEPLSPPTLDYLKIVGEGKFSPLDFKDLFYDVHIIDDKNSPDFDDIPIDSETILVLNKPKYCYFNENFPGPTPEVTIISGIDSDEIGLRFFEIELFTSFGPGSIFFIPEETDRKVAAEFLGRLTLNVRGHGTFDGSLMTLRDWASSYESGGDKGWASFLFLTSLYISETKR